MKHYAWIIFVLLLVWGSVASAERLAVSVSIANIRSGPGKNYDILWDRGKKPSIERVSKVRTMVPFS